MRALLASVLALALLSGCAEFAPLPLPTEDTWTATLTGTSHAPGVAGVALAVSSAQQTTVEIQLTGLPAGADRPWHIHFGSCAAPGEIVGDPDAYGLLPGAGGAVQRQATIGLALRAEESYLVFVHASMEEMDTILACGDLTLDP